ncbi:hypothetical protein BS47DRAFT_489856 [Hydnum rufescens UP504]|uniref:Uncharacterized protein n=1 Tax=Hydnum rufescens UP504 TaxID=1448309 RepID=A0A9P6DK07_9AGAM|nr:hypothetical protein BS47DRAFT_489856 [Hydnum rufescens UP504]
MRMVQPAQVPSPPRQGLSAGAALYRHAMSAISTPTTPAGTNHPPSASTAPAVNQAPLASVPPAIPEFPSAEEEKTQQRYLQAKRAVEQHQRQSLVGPVPYDSLFPSNAGGSAITQGGSIPTSVSTLPSNIQSPQTHLSSLPGDEGSIRRHLGREQAAALVQRNVGGGPTPTPPPRRQASLYESPPPPISPLLDNGLRSQFYTSRDSIPPGYGGLDTTPNPQPAGAPYALSADQEKAHLGAMYDLDSTQGWLGQSNTSQPPPQPSVPPPAFENPMYDRPLNAAEEKARLKAQYEAEERAATMQSAGAGGLPAAFESQGVWSPPIQNQSLSQYDQPQGGHVHWNSSNREDGGPQPLSMSVPPPPPLPESDIIYSPVPTRPHNEFSEQMSMGPNGHNPSEAISGLRGGASLSRDPTVSEGKRRASMEIHQQLGTAPPLFPRPPAEYVQESQGSIEPNVDGETTLDGHDFSLDVREFSPLDISFSGDRPFGIDGPLVAARPPIPPKVPI